MENLLNLEKVNEPGSLRWIGGNYHGLEPDKTIIAGKSIKSISSAIKLPCYKYGRINIENVFIAHDSEKIFYVFVNPKYKDYRKVFQRIVTTIPDGFHIDHVLSKNLAIHFGYTYVLLSMIPQNVNIKHGRYEKIKMTLDSDVPDVCYSDDRIFDKILSRPPLAIRSIENIIGGYQPTFSPNYGLTLKQKGIWNSALGFNSIDMVKLITETSLAIN